jgi:hypothetical protein
MHIFDRNIGFEKNAIFRQKLLKIAKIKIISTPGFVPSTKMMVLSAQPIVISAALHL